ncbi:MAG: M3 family oligoendopeptidase [Armatimonadetes bacterium]|nr:M3 family oligoendopeptidase [Armatimonadota bacterium]
MATQQEFAQFVERHTAATQPLHKQNAEAWWKASTTGEKHFEEESARLEAALRKVYANPEEYALVRDTLASGTLTEAHLKRLARLLSHAYLGNQMPPEEIDRIVALEKEIESEFNNHRAKVDGEDLTDNQIKEILRHETSEERRRAAWEGSKQVGARVAERVLRLVGMRNENARRLGFRNFYHLQLELQDLDEERLFAQLGALAVQTEDVWKRFKNQLDARLGGAGKPWHYSDPFFQELPDVGELSLDPYFEGKRLEDLTKRFYEAIGLQIDDILARSDLYERPGKCQHAFCMDVDRLGDVRVLCNLKSDEYWMGTMLHELGHAVYDKYIDPTLPFHLREAAHTLFTEAVAMFMGRLVKDGRWLRLYADVPAEVAAQADAALRTQMLGQLLVFVRWGLVVTHFERAMYQDPTRDLNTLWWDLVERFQGVSRPTDRNAPDWASKIHIATAPAYYQNYILGEMAASQMLHHLTNKVLAGDAEALVRDPRVGEWFVKDIFRPGTSAHWEEILERATGEPLNPRYLVDGLLTL